MKSVKFRFPSDIPVGACFANHQQHFIHHGLNVSRASAAREGKPYRLQVQKATQLAHTRTPMENGILTVYRHAEEIRHDVTHGLTQLIRSISRLKLVHSFGELQTEAVACCEKALPVTKNGRGSAQRGVGGFTTRKVVLGERKQRR